MLLLEGIEVVSYNAGVTGETQLAAQAIIAQLSEIVFMVSLIYLQNLNFTPNFMNS